MKRSITLFILSLITGICQAQTIDTSALHILQKSFDKLAAMKTIHYRITMVDTMKRENSFHVSWFTVNGTIKKNAYWHLRLENKAEWLVRGDTLYKKETPDAQVVFTKDWDRHKIGSSSIHSILGTTRPRLDKSLALLKFVRDTSAGEFYVIDESYNFSSEDRKGDSKVNRYFIDKKSLFAYRRIMHGKFMDEGKEAIDIYDFSVSLDTNPVAFKPAVFFDTPAVEESDRFETLKTGTVAPLFKATDLRTGKGISLNALKGKVIVLDFWYLSCYPCRQLMPKLQKLQDKFGKENVIVVGINPRDVDSKTIIKFLNEKHISYTQYYQTEKWVGWDYKLQAFPTTLVLGKDGKVKLVESGFGEATEGNLENAIKKELETKIHTN